VDEGGSVDEVSRSLKRLRGGPRGSFFTGDPGRYVKKVWVRTSFSAGDPLSPGNPVGGVARIPRTLIYLGSPLTRNFQRQWRAPGKEHLFLPELY
jgi:hypothetical protein